MPRKKAVLQNSTTPDVLHGCVDCVYREAPMQKQPCKGCTQWSNWMRDEEKFKLQTERQKVAKKHAMKLAKETMEKIKRGELPQKKGKK